MDPGGREQRLRRRASAHAEHDNVAPIASAARLESIAAEEGARYGAELLRMPASKWRGLMRENPLYRSYGTLKFLLQVARDKFERQPSVAHEITSAVLHFVQGVEGPTRIATIGLRGLAEKEHANALQCCGDLPAALQAAERAISIYDQLPVKFDRACACLVASHVLREMGELERAAQTARDAAAVFDDYDHAEYRTIARITEGIIYFAQKRFREGFDVFTAVVEAAERAGDTVTLARGLNNLAECARELGDIDSARDLYPRAIAYFEENDLRTEVTRAKWGQALCLAASGSIASAVSELFQVRALYLSLGMHTHAASAGLDIVRIDFESAKDVRERCAELVRLFMAAGMTQAAIEALAYLREQAVRKTITIPKIKAVRSYFDELPRRPALLFVPPRDEEEG